MDSLCFIDDRINTSESATIKFISFSRNGVKLNTRKPIIYNDFDKLALGSSFILHQWLINDKTKSNESNMISDYDIVLIESLEFSDLIENDLDLFNNSNNHIEIGGIPSISEIFKFHKYVYGKLQLIPPLIIISYIYLKAIVSNNNLILTNNNFRFLYIMSLIIAQKIWIEPHRKTIEFSQLFLNINRIFNQNEKKLFQSIKDLNIENKTYSDTFKLFMHESCDKINIKPNTGSTTPIIKKSFLNNHIIDPITPLSAYTKSHLNLNQAYTSKYNNKNFLMFSHDNYPTGYHVCNPKISEILFSMSTVIQAQIFQDLNVHPDLKLIHNDFDVIPDLLPEFGGEITSIPDRMLIQESTNDLVRQELLAFNVPTSNTILKYLTLIRSRAHYSVECNIIGLILLNRLTSVSKIPLKKSNWRSLWLTCVIIAQKVWDDSPMNSPDFSYIIPTFTPQMLLNWELKVLTLLDWSVTVKPSIYSTYYFELRQLFFEKVGTPNCTSIDLKYKPIARKYLFNLIEGSTARGVKNYSRVNGKHKIEFLSTKSTTSDDKGENPYLSDSIVYDISESKDDSCIRNRTFFLRSHEDELKEFRVRVKLS